MWLSRDLDMERARIADFSMSMNRPPPDPYRHGDVISPDVDLDSTEGTDGAGPTGQKSSSHGVWPLPQSQQQLQLQQAEELIAMEGEYSLNYTTLQPIGKGAFGFVRLAQKIEDQSMVCCPSSVMFQGDGREIGL